MHILCSDSLLCYAAMRSATGRTSIRADLPKGKFPASGLSLFSVLAQLMSSADSVPEDGLTVACIPKRRNQNSLSHLLVVCREELRLRWRTAPEPPVAWSNASQSQCLGRLSCLLCGGSYERTNPTHLIPDVRKWICCQSPWGTSASYKALPSSRILAGFRKSNGAS